MSRPLQVVVLNGSPNANSKTVSLATLVTDTLGGMQPIRVRQVDVYELGPSFGGQWERERMPPEVEEALVAVETCDVLVAATPVYRGSYSGMFKHFFDLIDQYALANKPVILVATGGSDRHALVIEYALRPLFGFFQANTLPVGFYASSGDFSGTMIMNPEIYGRVEVGLADAAATFQAAAQFGA